MFNEAYWQEKTFRQMVQRARRPLKEWRAFAFLRGLFWKETILNEVPAPEPVKHTRSQKARRLRRNKHHQRMVSIQNA